MSHKLKENFSLTLSESNQERDKHQRRAYDLTNITPSIVKQANLIISHMINNAYASNITRGNYEPFNSKKEYSIGSLSIDLEQENGEVQFNIKSDSIDDNLQLTNWLEGRDDKKLKDMVFTLSNMILENNQKVCTGSAESGADYKRISKYSPVFDEKYIDQAFYQKKGGEIISGEEAMRAGPSEIGTDRIRY